MESNEKLSTRLDNQQSEINLLKEDMAVVKTSVINHIPTALATLSKDVSAVRNWIILTLLALVGGLLTIISRGH